jgi:hypothetical protein
MAAIFHSRLKPKTFTDDKGVNHLNNNKKYLFPFHSAVGTRQRNEFHKLEKFDHDRFVGQQSNFRRSGVSLKFSSK